MGRRLGLLALAAASLFATYWSLRLAWSDHLSHAGDRESLSRALGLAPGDADLHLKLAALEQSSGGDPTAQLRQAVTLDPQNAGAWIKLGLASELGGDYSAAENHLLEAARVSHQFAPRWALANFYFRRGDEPHFWQCTKESLDIGYSELDPVFDLCWNMRADAEPVERILPDRNAVLNAYVSYCMRKQHVVAAQQTATKLAAQATPEDEPTLVAWVNTQIDAGSPSGAVRVWNALCTRRILPYPSLDEERAPLTDGDFGWLSHEDGFAWRLYDIAGTTCGRNRTPPYLWVAFSGDQPEACTPVMQFVPAARGAGFDVRFEYRTADLPPASGVRWTVFEPHGDQILAASPWLSSAAWKRANLRFAAPASGLVRLALTYERLTGATRAAGSVNVRGMTVERVP